MFLHEKIVAARKRKGFTQVELAEMTKVTVRTIQRIENGETTPRAFTLKAIASVLDIPLEDLSTEQKIETSSTSSLIESQQTDADDQKDFLIKICLSCFSYLVVPYLHFLIPNYLLKKYGPDNAAVRQFGKKLIRQQMIWVIGVNLLLLLTVGYNILVANSNSSFKPIHFLLPIGIMYVTNAVLILSKTASIKKLENYASAP